MGSVGRWHSKYGCESVAHAIIIVALRATAIYLDDLYWKRAMMNNVYVNVRVLITSIINEDCICIGVVISIRDKTFCSIQGKSSILLYIQFAFIK